MINGDLRLKKTTLFLFTDSFPYGKGEKTFILPELPALLDNFDVTVISSAPQSDYEQKELITPLPDEIQVIWYPMGAVTGISVINYLLPFLFYKGSWQEIITIIKTRKHVFSRIKKTLFFFADAERFRRWLKKENILGTEKAICYSYWYVHRILSIARERKKHPNIKLITRAHGYDLYEERNSCCWQPYKSIMDAYVDKVFFISQHGYDYYRERFSRTGQNPAKYIINYLGTDRQIQSIKKERRNCPFLLVSCASILPVKRISLIVEALALLEHCNIRWVHFGDGSDFDKIREQARKLLDGKPDILYELRGHVANKDIISYYKTEKPDCFIMTSVSEGSPVAMQEAISFGVPIIGTAVGGIPEMIDQNGILLSENPSAMEAARAIQCIYDMDDEAYQKMERKSLQIWTQKYDREKNIREFIQILNRISDEE